MGIRQKSERSGDTGDSGESVDSEDWGKSLYVAKKLRTSWNPEGFGALGVWEIPKIGKFRRLGDCDVWVIGGLGEIFLRGKKLEPLGTPIGSGDSGNSEASGDTGNLVVGKLRRIGENRYMWRKGETLSGRTHGNTSGDWKVRETGKFGKSLRSERD